MKRPLISLVALSLIGLLIFPYPVVAGSTSAIDQTLPIERYCDSTLYACNGYQPITDEQYLPPWAPEFKNVQGYYRNDLASLYRFPSYAIAITRDSAGNGRAVFACSDIASVDCTGTEIHYRADLPLCSMSLFVDCMRDISITDSSDRPLEYSVLGQFPLGNPQYFKGSVKLKVPNGGGPTLIRVPSAPHAGGDTYLIKSQVSGAKRQASQSFVIDNLTMSITAVKVIDGKYTYSGVSTNPNLYLKGFDSIGAESGTYPSICAIASTTQCAAKYSLPMKLRFGVTVDLSQRITGWLHGRVKRPEIEVTSNQSGGSTLKVSAEPIKIPVNSTWINNDSAAPILKNFYAGKSNSGSPLFGNDNKSRPLTEIALMRDGNTGHNLETLSEYLAWLPALGDKAQALPTAWSVQTMGNYQVSNEIKRCLDQTDALVGIVTTNAAEYLDGPPTFDKKLGVLDYKVAATHFEPDGKTEFKGTYDLVMSSKVARCIYNFNGAPISATVTVTSEDGADNVATTVVKESGGWLSLGAYNFTFSSPVIRIKLSGTPLTSAVAPFKVAVKKITCVKGKKIKVVTSAKCPAGYLKRK
jgi:hypothetical protein